MSTKPYDVEVNGLATTLMLSDDDAKAQGLFKAPAKAAAKPTSATGAGGDTGTTVAAVGDQDEKAVTARNKARAAANKKAPAPASK